VPGGTTAACHSWCSSLPCECPAVDYDERGKEQRFHDVLAPKERGHVHQQQRADGAEFCGSPPASVRRRRCCPIRATIV
jgi:hypothetical protein